MNHSEYKHVELLEWHVISLQGNAELNAGDPVIAWNK
jgi:hypothetical protein